jgi:hypothetical protein
MHGRPACGEPVHEVFECGRCQAWASDLARGFGIIVTCRLDVALQACVLMVSIFGDAAICARAAPGMGSAPHGVAIIADGLLSIEQE